MDRVEVLREIVEHLRSVANDYGDDGYGINLAADIIEEDLVRCLCKVGCQACPVHPGNLRTKEEKIAFRKEWDARAVLSEGGI